MSELVRTVRSGIVGLDLALAGGFRFLRRSYAGDRESATLLVRGGPGVGKSVLAQDLALRLAGKVGGDALYFCVEVLPSEVLAQRMGFDDFDPAAVVDLSRKGNRDPSTSKPSLVLGMLEAPIGEDGVPDLGAPLLELHRIAASRGYNPKVVVIDSLSEGYGLGTSAPREVVDGLCKLAVEQGWALILVEEAPTDAPSPWAFAVDTVLSLRLAPAQGDAQARRELVVTKHRFGGCEPGPHGLLIERERVRVIPPLSAYRNAVRDLDLPPPAKGRTLAVETATPTEFPGWFHVGDDEGRIVVTADPEGRGNADLVTASLGRSAQWGDLPSGAAYTFYLEEAQQEPRLCASGDVRVNTLHQLVRADEWLEGVLHALSVTGLRAARPLVHVRVGPTDRLVSYAQKAELHAGISLLARMLSARGLLVILFGTESNLLLRYGIATDGWTLGRLVGTAQPPPVCVTAQPLRLPGLQAFLFTPKLDVAH